MQLNYSRFVLSIRYQPVSLLQLALETVFADSDKFSVGITLFFVEFGLGSFELFQLCYSEILKYALELSLSFSNCD